MVVLRTLLAATAMAAVFIGAVSAVDKATEPKAGSAVRLALPEGNICSGVHIGNGYIVTAEHCIEKLKDVQFETDEGPDRYTADVLWTNPGFDIALLQARSINHMKTTPVVCRPPVRGEAITAHGNPLRLRFFVSAGTIGVATKDKVGRWQSVIVINAPIASGMSGGPVLDSGGNLLGITVASVGRIAPFGLAVPVETVCTLLARS